MGLAALLLAEQVWAYPGFDGLDLFSEYVMPANGVFVLGPLREFPVPEEHGLTISVEGPGGPVSGSVEVVSGMLVFRPDQQLELGEHTVTPIPAEGTKFSGPQPTFTVRVTEPVAIDPPEFSCSLSLASTLGAGSSELCCGVLPRARAAEPHCFATMANTRHVGLSAMSCPFDHDDAEPDPALCWLIEAPACERSLWLERQPTPCPLVTPVAPDRLSGSGFSWSAAADGVPALVQAEEYCVEIECLDLWTGLPIGARRCEPDPGLEPVEVDVLEVDEADLGIVYGCEVPPAGFEQDWCDLNRAYYDRSCVRLLPIDAVSKLRCAEYETRCVPTTGEEPVEEPAVQPALVTAEPGCGCHAARSPGAAAGAWLGLLALGSLRRRRGTEGAVNGGQGVQPSWPWGHGYIAPCAIQIGQKRWTLGSARVAPSGGARAATGRPATRSEWMLTPARA